MIDVDKRMKRRRRERSNLRWKDASKRYNRRGAERGQHSKLGSMDEYGRS